MAISNRERVRKGLDETRDGLIPFVERELKAKLGGYWIDEVESRIRGIRKNEDGSIHWDSQALFVAMTGNWQAVFKFVLGHVERSYVGELIDVRNKWAHEKPFQSEDVYRALDTMQRLMEAISASERADELGRLKTELQRQVFSEQARNKTRQQLTLEGTPKEGLKGWRELMQPHKDVASGRYMQAEFAADLSQVHQGRGSDEYLDPNEFYRRTFITVGLRDLLVGALQRLAKVGGDPVLELQTNFGGGKTHSMLALYHLFSGVETGSLEGIEPVLQEAGVNVAPKANRAVLVGTAMSPGEVTVKDDGTEVRTMWGEMAWQLGGRAGYELVAESDRQGTSPGSAMLAELFEAHSPCLILIDEWVAYARQLFHKDGLPAGSFDGQSSFAQALTEAAKAAPGTLVVASIPQSRIEIGGDHGQEALEVLKNVFTRVAKPWRAATGDEGFEIVRRRLFEPMTSKDDFASRDAVINQFAKLYRDNDSDFPRECREGTYKDEMRASYPIHPELFRRLYDDWSTLDKFQRTRGVLRLLAKVIHRLWESQDGGLMIMPSSVPMDDHAVKSELTRYLADVWEPIISQDVDGPSSLPLQMDQEVRNLGRYSACRRVARALYIATAPGSDNNQPGRGAEHLRLACVQPGETVGTFGDALRRISEKAQYVHQDGNRYWLSTKANLNRTADDRARDLLNKPEELYAEINKRLTSMRTRSAFAGVHICPPDAGDIPDEDVTRLVILRPDQGHKRKDETSIARSTVETYLRQRTSNAPRQNQNTLVFLAPDTKELESLKDATAAFMAWSSILDDTQGLNLDQFQIRLATSKKAEFDGTVDLTIHAAWCHALVPYQADPAGEITWEELKIGSGADDLATRVFKKLSTDELVLDQLSGVRLRMELDKHLWKQRDHVKVSELIEWFPRYLYLPRVTRREVLIESVKNGLAALMMDDTFAVADAYDENAGRYLGLRSGGSSQMVGNGSFIVKPEIARAQLKRDQEAQQDLPPATSSGGSQAETSSSPGGALAAGPSSTAVPPEPVKPNVFVGSVKLNGARVGRSAGQIADEVLSHLVGLSGAQVEVSMEIQIKVPGGVDSDTVRIVRENASALRFDHAGFERE